MKRFLRWIYKNFRIDLNAKYEPIRPKARNRHERRCEAKKDRCYWEWLMKGVPWYRWHELSDVLFSAYSAHMKNKKNNNNENM